MSGEGVSLHAIVRGRVQGVYFRDFVRVHAQGLHLTGYVRNLADGVSVEVYAEGRRPDLEELLKRLWQGPPRARVDSVNPRWGEAQGALDSFDIRH